MAVIKRKKRGVKSPLTGKAVAKRVRASGIGSGLSDAELAKARRAAGLIAKKRKTLKKKR